MPYADPDPQDPQVLVGVALPGGPQAVGEMAWVFAEEFARLGFDEERIVRLFRSPGYRAAHQALRVLGEVEVRRIAREAARVFGAVRVRVVDGPRPPSGARPLPVIGRSKRL